MVMINQIFSSAASFNSKYMAMLCLCLFLSLQAFTQNDTSFVPQPEKVIYGKFSKIFIDNLFNAYLVSEKGDGLIKLNAGGDYIGAYNDVRRYGNISFIDVSNPLKTLVYFKDFNVIVALDRLLNTTATFDLRRSGILQSSAVALSYDNNIWVYDSRDAKLKKMNEAGKVIFESADFKTLFASVPQPTHIIDKDGMLYLYDKNVGLMIFDYYGALKTTYAFKDYEDVFVHNQTFYARKNNFLFYSALNAMRESTIALPVENISQIQMVHPFLFFLSSGNIMVYKKEVY